MSSFMLKYLTCCATDCQMMKDEIFELMDNPVEFFLSRAEDAKWFCVLISTIQLIGLFLAPSYFGNFLPILIAFVSLIASALTAVLGDGLKSDVVRSTVVRYFSNGEARWGHIQYTISLTLASSHVISVILQIALTTKYGIYLFTTVMSLLLLAAYIVEAMAGLRMDSGTDEERATITVAQEV